jgi:hypothetical protein
LLQELGDIARGEHTVETWRTVKVILEVLMELWYTDIGGILRNPKSYNIMMKV